MDMGGNLKEVSISVGNVKGRAFTNVNGDGTLDAIGDANVLSWPTLTGSYSLRGGYYNDAAARLNISDRYIASDYNSFGNRYAFIGIRLARTAE